jgi:hypothetical protein
VRNQNGRLVFGQGLHRILNVSFGLGVE